MSNIPVYVPTLFVATLAVTLILFVVATKLSRMSILLLAAWTIVQGVLTAGGFYTVTEGFPPRFAFILLPPNLVTLWLFATKNGREIIDQWDAKLLTLVHSVRVPVEIVLYWLFIYRSVPEIMTFVGQNFDILAGFTAPLVVYFGYYRQSLSKTALLVWNVVSLGLLINIVVTALLSIPGPLHFISFEQPNIALTAVPYNWLASVIVPLVFVSHLVTIRGLVRPKPHLAITLPS